MSRVVVLHTTADRLDERVPVQRDTVVAKQSVRIEALLSKLAKGVSARCSPRCPGPRRTSYLHGLPLSAVTDDVLRDDTFRGYLEQAELLGCNYVTMVVSAPAHVYHFHAQDLSFPSGGTEPVDGSLEDTARREMLEETGLADIGELRATMDYKKPRFRDGVLHERSTRPAAVLWFM